MTDLEALVDFQSHDALRVDDRGASLPLVIAVVLNTNRREDTLACHASLIDNTYSNLG